MLLRHLLTALALLALTACQTAKPGPTQMIAAANPHGAEAGMAMLRKGGSAVDAAIAAALVLNLVEPQSAGIGGGAFLLHFDGKTKEVAAYDGRETAPAAATPGLFLKADGEPMGFWEAVVGGRSVGVPGLIRLFELAHRDQGRLPWADLFQPAIELAEGGFAISPRLHKLIARDKYLKTYAPARAYFFGSDGAPLPVGHSLRNPAFARTLRALAAGGADAFYEGPIAAAIAETVQGAEGNPGAMTRADLAGYEAKRRDPVCGPYRAWRVCGMPPPTSGGVAVLQMLGILSHFDLAALAPGSAEAAHLIAEASRLAFADRGRFLADADFVPVPVAELLDPAYLAKRAALIDPAKSMGPAEPGLPPRQAAMPPQTDPPATTHLVTADRWGNVVSLTASIEGASGSRLMVGGFLLNNELTDFSFRPEAEGRPVANRVQPGKRPRSSMAPSLVLDGASGDFLLAAGSPGGSRIIGYTLKTLIAALDWNLPMQAAIDLPHVINRNGKTDLEEGTSAAALAPALEALGHEVNVRGMTSGLHGLRKGPDGLTGGADPRREGIVLAE